MCSATEVRLQMPYDWAMDCVFPPAGYTPIPAISLALEPANLTAIANDVGHRSHLFAADDRTRAPGRRGHRNLYQRRFLQHYSCAGGGSQTGIADSGAAGYDGGEILRRRLADFNLVVHSDYIPRIQEVQASTYHVLRETLEVLARA